VNVQALQAKDITLVNYACSRVEPSRLFSETCLLEQKVIVSLLNQLAMDLTTHTDLKLRYMQEAIPSVDVKVSGDIGMKAFREVYDKLNAFLQSNPGPHARRGKTVLMLLTSLIA